MLNYSANGPSGYNLTNSLRFRRSASAFLSRTSSFSGTTNTISFWVKRGELGTRQVLFGWSDNSSNALYFQFINDNLDFTNLTSGSYNASLGTTQVFRDPSSWYHIVLTIDTTQATASNRLRLFINGSQVTAFAATTYPAQNTSLQLGNSRAWNIGREGNTGNNPGDYYLDEWNFIDGQALTPSSFGNYNSVTGVWQPAKYTGTYGTNGFYLNFSDIALTSGSNTGLGKDNSGNGNYWNTNNISVTAGSTYDAMSDVPTLTSATVANYCVLNPLDNGGNTLSAGNLNASSGVDKLTRATFGMSSGKWYCEVTITAVGGSTNIGIANSNASNTSLGNNANSWAYANNGQKVTSASGSSYGSSFTTNDIIGIAFDADTGSLTFYKNNTSQGVAFTGLTSGPYFIAYGSNAPTLAFNFGQRPFTYTPPTGFVALNTFNLPSSTIPQGNKVMDATTYTGNGTTQTITNAGAFKPDLVWIKRRSNAADNVLYDSVRTLGVALSSNLTSAEPAATNGLLTAFNSNGFGVAVVSGDNTTNGSSPQTFVGWQWQAGQGSTSSNTSGSITSTVSVNATAGFSVVTYSGNSTTSTIGHGLGVTPSMFIVKRRNSTGNWYVYHQSLGATKTINLNLGDAAYTTANAWANTAPTSSVISVSGVSAEINNTGGTYVAYCWAEIVGFSKFGSYTGNGSADGPFIYTGFRPKFIMVKKTDTSSDWWIWDTSRNTYNQMQSILYGNISNAEVTNAVFNFDALSNGFKNRSTDVTVNGNGGTYIYMAFAENPFKNALAR